MNATEPKSILKVSKKVKSSKWYDPYFYLPVYNESYDDVTGDLIKLDYLSDDERQLVFNTMMKYKNFGVLDQYIIFNAFSEYLMSDYNPPRKNIPNKFFDKVQKRFLLYMFYHSLIGDIVFDFISNDANFNTSFRNIVNNLISNNSDNFYKITSVFNLHKHKDKIVNIRHHFIVCDNFDDQESNDKLLSNYTDKDNKNKEIIDRMNINEIVRDNRNKIYYELTSILYTNSYYENNQIRTSYLCIFRYKYNLWMANEDGVYIIDNVKDFTNGYHPKFLVYNRLYKRDQLS